MPDDEMKPRSEEWIISREARRSEIHNRAVQGLFILNGGGAVALLSFLSQIWGNAHELIPWVAVGISFMGVGLMLTGTLHFLRYESSRKHDHWKTRREGQKFSRAFRYFSAISLLMFAIGIGVVVWGVFHVPWQSPSLNAEGTSTGTKTTLPLEKNEDSPKR